MPFVRNCIKSEQLYRHKSNRRFRQDLYLECSIVTPCAVFGAALPWNADIKHYCKISI